jgi:membrane protein implicated in regulation of membrane protease activity
MAWWLWVLAGIGLLVVEMLTPGGLFALFFGVAAILCVAPLAALGADPVTQWLTFTAVSLVLLATLRRPVQERLFARKPAPIDSLVGEEVTLLADVPEGGEGKAELRGSPWSARAVSGLALAKGQRCTVERVDGLTLWLRAQ